jgi:hypothetical protein
MPSLAETERLVIRPWRNDEADRFYDSTAASRGRNGLAAGQA